MKKILFNTPLNKKKYSDNVKKLLDSKKSLHGPGKNILQTALSADRIGLYCIMVRRVRFTKIQI